MDALVCTTWCSRRWTFHRRGARRVLHRSCGDCARGRVGDGFRQRSRDSGRQPRRGGTTGRRNHHDDAARGWQVRRQRVQSGRSLHGVGVSVVNALSERLELIIHRDGRTYRQVYRDGDPETDLENVGQTTRRGTVIRFRPSTNTFTNIAFHYDNSPAGSVSCRFSTPEYESSCLTNARESRTSSNTAEGFEPSSST